MASASSSLSSSSYSSAHTPLQLAEAGASISMGAALLKLRRGCNLGTATRAMREAYALLRVPVADRLCADLRQTVCKEMNVPYGPVRLGLGCAEEADGETVGGMPSAWMMTGNREAIVPSYMRG